MQYDSIMGMLFYEFQNVLETYSSILEERREEEEAADNGYDISDYSSNSIMRNAQNYMSKMPQIPSMPKIDIPKF